MEYFLWKGWENEKKGQTYTIVSIPNQKAEIESTLVRRYTIIISPINKFSYQLSQNSFFNETFLRVIQAQGLLTYNL